MSNEMKNSVEVVKVVGKNNQKEDYEQLVHKQWDIASSMVGDKLQALGVEKFYYPQLKQAVDKVFRNPFSWKCDPRRLMNHFLAGEILEEYARRGYPGMESLRFNEGNAAKAAEPVFEKYGVTSEVIQGYALRYFLTGLFNSYVWDSKRQYHLHWAEIKEAYGVAIRDLPACIKRIKELQEKYGAGEQDSAVYFEERLEQYKVWLREIEDAEFSEKMRSGMAGLQEKFNETVLLGDSMKFDELRVSLMKTLQEFMPKDQDVKAEFISRFEGILGSIEKLIDGCYELLEKASAFGYRAYFDRLCVMLRNASNVLPQLLPLEGLEEDIQRLNAGMKSIVPISLESLNDQRIRFQYSGGPVGQKVFEEMKEAAENCLGKFVVSEKLEWQMMLTHLDIPNAIASSMAGKARNRSMSFNRRSSFCTR